MQYSNFSHIGILGSPGPLGRPCKKCSEVHFFFWIDIYETKKNQKYFLFWTISSGAAGKKLDFLAIFELYWFYFLKHLLNKSFWLRIMFYIILEIPDNGLKDESNWYWIFCKFIVLYAVLAPKSSILLMRTCIPIELNKKLIFFHFLYFILILKCHYFLKYLQKWSINEKFKKAVFLVFWKL